MGKIENSIGIKSVVNLAMGRSDFDNEYAYIYQYFIDYADCIGGISEKSDLKHSLSTKRMTLPKGDSDNLIEAVEWFKSNNEIVAEMKKVTEEIKGLEAKKMEIIEKISKVVPTDRELKLEKDVRTTFIIKKDEIIFDNGRTEKVII